LNAGAGQNSQELRREERVTIMDQKTLPTEEAIHRIR
jgi:hypothetical protein